MLVDLALMILGFMGFGVQITYDSQLTAPWNIPNRSGSRGGTISKLYSTNQTFKYNDYNVVVDVNGADIGQYNYFYGFWTAMDVIYNMSQSLGQDNVYNLVISFFNNRCGPRGWSILFTESMSIRSLFALLVITVILQCIQMIGYILYYFKQLHILTFTICLISTKVIYLIAFSMYLLYLHNINLPIPDPKPHVLSVWLISTTVIYWIFLVSNSIVLWLFLAHNEDYEELE